MEQKIIYKILILTSNSFVDLSAPLYLLELATKENKSGNTRLADDFLLLIMPLIRKGNSNTFLNDSLFTSMLHLLSKVNWKVVLEKIINFDSFKREIKATYF